jgi:hypothetical protein
VDGLGSGMLAAANVSAGPVKDAATCAEHISAQANAGGDFDNEAADWRSACNVGGQCVA